MDLFWKQIENFVNQLANPNWTDIATSIAAITAVIVTIIIAIRQNGLAKKQNDISMKQTEIAEKQNEIALFEKKYEVYSALKQLLGSKTYLGLKGAPPGIALKDMIISGIVSNVAGIEVPPNTTIEQLIIPTFNALNKIQSEIEKGGFLFDKEVYDNIIIISKKIQGLISRLLFESKIPLTNDIEEISKFENEILPLIEKILKL